MKYTILVAVFVVVCIIICCAFGVFFNSIKSYNPYEIVAVDEERMIEDVGNIVDKHTSGKFQSKIINGSEAIQQELYVDEDDYIFFKELGMQNKLLHIRSRLNYISGTANETELYGVFELFLYLKSKKLPDSLEGIVWKYRIDGGDNTLDEIIFISNAEFENLFNSTDITGLTRTQAAKELAHKWSEIVGYTRREVWDEQREESNAVYLKYHNGE